MEQVRSADGTEIGYERQTGDNPGSWSSPVICLHGTGVTRQVWRRFLRRATGATFVVPDRRGRGASGDTDPWTFERELEDATAVAAAEALDGPVTLFGSSFGGLVAMRVAERIAVDRLVLYEPPMPAMTIPDDKAVGVADEVDRRLRAGDREGATRVFFEEATGATGVEDWPIWPDCVALAETIARECHIVESFEPRPLSVPTLLFRGAYSPAYLQDGIGVLADLLSDTRTVEVDAAHAGVATAPDRIVTALRSFLA